MLSSVQFGLVHPSSFFPLMLHKPGDRFRAEFGVETIALKKCVPATQPKPTASARRDGRAALQFRQIFLKTGVVSQAPGSCYIELGKTKIICAVYGPKQSTFEYSDKAELLCDFKFASFAQNGKRSGYMLSPEELELGHAVTKALENSILLCALSDSSWSERFPKSVIDINIIVLQADGSVLSAAITAASMAVASAGIASIGLIASCSACALDGKVVLDPTEEEELAQESAVMVALIPQFGEISQVSQFGVADVKQCAEMINTCIEGCVEMHKLMKQHFLDSSSTPTRSDKK